jgi:hypothetical protein
MTQDEQRCECGCGTATLKWRGKYNRFVVGHGYVRHRESHTRLYIIWMTLIGRCETKSAGAYKFYGARGIRVCDEWHDYKTFRDWALENGYQPALQIDRINGLGNYTPDNCRFVTTHQQARNRSTNRFLTAFGEQKIVSDWATDPRCVVGHDTLRTRINRGWNHVDAITRKRRAHANAI